MRQTHRISKPAAVLAPIVALLLILLSGCGAPTVESTPSTATSPASAPTPTVTATTVSPLPTPTVESPLPTPTMVSPIVTPEPPEAGSTVASPEAATWTADGSIDEDEYTQSADFGFLRLWWRHDGTYLYIAIEGDTTGWVSVGIDPVNGMQGANYLFGYVAKLDFSDRSA